MEAYLLGLLILRHGHTWLASDPGQLDRRNLPVKQTVILSSLGPLVGPDGVVILLLAIEAVVSGTLLGGKTHMFPLAIGVLKTILQDTIYKGLVAVLGTVAQVGQIVRGVGHRFHATGNDDIGATGLNGLHAQNNRLQPGGADLIHSRAHGALRQPGANGCLSGGVLAKAVNR